MIVPVILVFLFCQSTAEPLGVKYRCNDTGSNVTYATFTPSSDAVSGRYTAELCSLNHPNRTHLSMDLMYNENKNVCSTEYRKRRSRWGRKPGPQHSSNTVDITGLTNCTYVCYAMDFDLIFSSCYELKSSFKEDGNTCAPYDSYHLINNNITKESYEDTKTLVSPFNHDNYVTLHWYLKIPAVDYTVTLRDNNTGEMLDGSGEVTQNCSALDQARQLRCELAPPQGCYVASLEHGGLWTNGVFHNLKTVDFDFCYRVGAAPLVRARRGGWGAAAAAAGALAAAALLAGALLRRELRKRAFYKKVLEYFRTPEEQPESPPPPPAPRDSRAVLLLYAREGPFGHDAVTALRDLIQHATGGTVYDIYSPDVMSLCGPAPHSWVHAVLTRADVRVVLLQSPATAALYQDQLYEDDSGLRLRAPLMGRRAMYRRPHYGDTLLQKALRQLAENTETHRQYDKYYLVTYQGLETDILPQVVPYSRYVLPDAAPALVLKLSRREPDADKLQQYCRATHALLTHVQHNPDYLMDEIVIN